MLDNEINVFKVFGALAFSRSVLHSAIEMSGTKQFSRPMVRIFALMPGCPLIRAMQMFVSSRYCIAFHHHVID